MKDFLRKHGLPSMSKLEEDVVIQDRTAWKILLPLTSCGPI